MLYAGHRFAAVTILTENLSASPKHFDIILKINSIRKTKYTPDINHTTY